MVFLTPDALRFHPGQHRTIDFCEIAEIKKAAAIADSPGSSCYPQKGNAAGWSLSTGIPAATAAKTARNLSATSKNCFLRFWARDFVLRQHRTMGAAGFGGSFAPIAQYEKWEIHTVFPHFSYFRLGQNLTPNLLAPLCGAALTKVLEIPEYFVYCGIFKTHC